MAKTLRSYFILIPAVSVCLMLIAGCDVAMNPAIPIVRSTQPLDLATFIQQFAREALAAFLL